MATPDYEVKLLLDPSTVLGADKKLTAAVLEAFDMPTSVTKINVQFVDRSKKEIYDDGWNLRIRRIEDEDEFELTYKKRYEINGGDIGGGINLAKIDGFDGTDKKWKAQVEWGHKKQTLSISRKKDASDSRYSELDLPNGPDSRDMLKKEAPAKFKEWLDAKWGPDALEKPYIYGPVFTKRSVGSWKDLELTIEIWPILDESGTGMEYIVEASFKTDSNTTASTEQANLIKLLQDNGWFLPGDSLKTKLIMDRYKGSESS